MSVAGILDSSSKLSRQFQPTANVVFQYQSGPGITPSGPVETPVQLAQQGLYILQIYVDINGAGGNAGTGDFSLKITIDGAEGWAQLNLLPTMIAADEGPYCTSLTFLREVPETSVFRVIPGADFNVGASGNIEAKLWYIAPAQIV